MGLTDKLKDLTQKAEDAAVEHKDQIQQAMQKAETAADQRTGGKYHEQLRKAGAKAETFLDGLKESETPPGTAASAEPEGNPKGTD
ncbi:MAG TPA: antitoxin [Solirubrobacteraceae bacterium]|jgi:DNA-binding protein H-NS